MFSLGFFAAFILTGPVGFAMGVFAARDRRVERVKLIGPTLKREVR